MRLARSPEGLLRMSDLAAQTTLTSSGITRVVDRLVERGLVTRRACATDRRTTYAVITDTGRDLLERLLPGHLELLEEWLVGPLRGRGLDEFVGRAAAAARPGRALRDGRQRRGAAVPPPSRPSAEAG